jgi:hypothetical protein
MNKPIRYIRLQDCGFTGKFIFTFNIILRKDKGL